MTGDPVMGEIQDAIALMHGGDRIGARADFERIWRDVPLTALQECVLSHFMADTQDTVQAELAWDLRAWEAARRCTDDDVQQVGQGLSIGQFMPSLHLNLADDYDRLGQPESARTHLDAALAWLKTAPASPYMDMIRGGVLRLESRMAAPPTG